MTLLLVLSSLIFLLITWYRTTWGVLLIVLILPTYLWRFQIGFVPFTYLELAILILTVVWILKALILGRYIYLGSFKWPLVLLIIIAGISVLVSPDREAALGLFKAYFLEPILYFIVLVNVIRKEKYFKYLLSALGISVIFISLVSLVQYLGWIESMEPWFSQTPSRVSSLFEYPNAVGLFLAPIITLFIGMILLPISKKYYLNGIFISLVVILGLLALYLSNVRGAILGVILGIFFISVFSPKRKWFWLGILIVMVLLIVLPTTQDKVIDLAQGKDVSFDVRTVLWRGTLDLLKNRPLLGAGLAGFPVLYDQYRLIKHTELLLSPHNIFLNFWVELGIVGLVTFLWLITKFFIQGAGVLKENKKTRLLAVSLMASMVTLIGYGLVDVPYFKNDLAVLFWILLGAMVILLNISYSLQNSKNTL